MRWIVIITAITSVFVALRSTILQHADHFILSALKRRTATPLLRSSNGDDDIIVDDYCLTSVDCAMNGECIRHSKDRQSPGKCQCFDGWRGTTCEVLDLLPIAPQTAGLQLPNHASSWGGSVVYVDGKYHMFASEIVNGCGLGYWTTNSQVIRAVSDHPNGPYVKQEVILPTFSHDANVLQRGPNGEIVLFVTALLGVKPVDCDNNDSSSWQWNNAVVPNTTAPPKDTYMLWAKHPTGPWSEPVLVLNSTIWNEDYWAKNHRFAHCDANLNGILRHDGSFLGLWRKCETPDLLTVPHTLYASDWKDASTYQPSIDPLFVLTGSGAEDPSNIWTTETSDAGVAYHAIFHDEQATRCMLGECPNVGRHAFSMDGKAWSYSKVNAYNGTVLFQNGTTWTADTRARPHLIVRDNQLLALSTGLKPTKESGYVWTLVQPLRHETEMKDV
ncbi:unnamed protein product [Cylindrotheca closterium]|uniref:EGF-like domain-containing protein n=1 Tax=Cylindrotheca closterium TaxID=2856 RepID=A0AAD2FH62_9STRA|nr:unnamed protein product [Cylindrotheca closterium]